MTNSNGSRSRRSDPGRVLSDAEKKLWHAVTKNISHYQPVENPNTDDQGQPESKTSQAGLPAKLPSSNRLVTPKLRTVPERAAKSARPIQNQSIFTAGDPAMDKRVKRGRLEIDAVLDLHGLTQSEAEERLRRFITLAQHQQARCVLVITGKGEHYDRQKHEPFSMHKTPRGILRTRFLDWVEQSPVRNRISRVAPAKPRDGGRGAFYIFLKRLA